MKNSNFPQARKMQLDDEPSQMIAASQYADLLYLHANSGAKKVSKGYIAKGMPLGAVVWGSNAGVASSPSTSTYVGSTGGSDPESSYSADSPDCSGSEGHTNSQLAHGNAALGLTMQKIVPGNLSASPLEHATDVLKAALANWEACLNNKEVLNRASAQQIREAHEVLKAAGLLKAAAMEPAQSMPAKTPKQVLRPSAASAPAVAAPSTPVVAAANPEASSLNALQKALFEWGFTLPAEAAHAAHQFLQQEREKQRQEIALRRAENNLQAIQLLKQNLEKEQEETMLTMIGMMQAVQQPVLQNSQVEAMAKRLMSVSAPGCGGNWPQVLGGKHQCPESAALEAAFSESPVFGPMPDAFGMHPMAMISHMPYGAQFSMPQAFNSPSDHLRQVHNPLGRQHDPSYRNGNGAAESAQAREIGIPAISASGEEETFTKILRELQKVDPDRVIHVRKINRLGFDSPKALEEYYSKYGKVDRVFVAHYVKRIGSYHHGPSSRMRPSRLGFVVMSKKEEASAILALGPEQVVNGVTIRIESFQPPATAKDAAHLKHEEVDVEQA